jgi:hypothetical protein
VAYDSDKQSINLCFNLFCVQMVDVISTYTVDEPRLSPWGSGNSKHLWSHILGWPKSEEMEMMLLSFVGQSVQAEWELSAQEKQWKEPG